MTLDRLMLERACVALAALVRQEYPDTYSLAEIAETWCEGVTPEQVDALRVLDAGSLGEFVGGSWSRRPPLVHPGPSPVVVAADPLMLSPLTAGADPRAPGGGGDATAVPDVVKPAGLPAFDSLCGPLFVKGRGWVITVKNPGGYDEPATLVGRAVLIDGVEHQVRGVESFAIGRPYPDRLDFALLTDWEPSDA